MSDTIVAIVIIVQAIVISILAITLVLVIIGRSKERWRLQFDRSIGLEDLTDEDEDGAT